MQRDKLKSGGTHSPPHGLDTTLRKYPQSHFNCAVAAMDSCFALIGTRQYGIVVRPFEGTKQCFKSLLLPWRVYSTLNTTHVGALSWEPHVSFPMAFTLICVPVYSIRQIIIFAPCNKHCSFYPKGGSYLENL